MKIDIKDLEQAVRSFAQLPQASQITPLQTKIYQSLTQKEAEELLAPIICEYLNISPVDQDTNNSQEPKEYKEILLEAIIQYRLNTKSTISILHLAFPGIEIVRNYCEHSFSQYSEISNEYYYEKITHYTDQDKYTFIFYIFYHHHYEQSLRKLKNASLPEYFQNFATSFYQRFVNHIVQAKKLDCEVLKKDKNLQLFQKEIEDSPLLFQLQKTSFEKLASPDRKECREAIEDFKNLVKKYGALNELSLFAPITYLEFNSSHDKGSFLTMENN